MADSTDVENQKKKKGQSDEHNSRERAFVPYRSTSLPSSYFKRHSACYMILLSCLLSVNESL